MLITNNEILLSSAKKNYHIFKVPTRNINPPKSKRHYTPTDLADLDDKTSNNKIGEIVNLSQELNSLLWDIVSKSRQSAEEQYDQIKEIYYDVCQLDVMSNIEIDKAKKEYPIDTTRELKRMRKKYENVLTVSDGRKRTPYFLGFIAETKNYKNVDKKDYQKYNTSMDYLHACINKNRSGKSMGSGFLSIADIFKPKEYNKKLVNQKQVNKIIQLAKNTSDYIKMISSNIFFYDDRYCYINSAKEELLYEINRMKINEHTMHRLLKNLEDKHNIFIKNLLFYVLFNYKNDILTAILTQYDKINTYLYEDKNGKIKVYGINFSQKSSPKEIL